VQQRLLSPSRRYGTSAAANLRRSGGRSDREAHRDALFQRAGALQIVTAQAEQAVIRCVRRGQLLPAPALQQPIPDVNQPGRRQGYAEQQAIQALGIGQFALFQIEAVVFPIQDILLRGFKLRESDPTLRDTILVLARRYDFEEGHSLQDERLALRLFDETGRVGLHRLGCHPDHGQVDSLQAGKEGQESPPDSDELLRSAQHDIAIASCSPREILSAAAILHDIGYVDGYEQHHKTAFRLIMADPIAALSPRDQTLIAHVARYHRGSTPDPIKHPAFAALPTADRVLVEQLGTILRFADGLDRSHANAVADLHCAFDGNRLIVTLLPGHNDEAERWAGQKKARWFESVYGVQVLLR
jgi:exopolyphosphatase/guanosine-5'-triphosphate,3'-diphosphate pyrophosphatase